MFSLVWLGPQPFCTSHTRDVSCFDCVVYIVYVRWFPRVLLIVYFLPKDEDGMAHPTITTDVEGANKTKCPNISMLDLD